MPSGVQDDSYGQRLNSIDWQDLYTRKGGYLMFEDLKAQWKALLDVDYVFIDSRTGHTDVGNICTRQLPDAVCVLFFPNEQNLLGLQRVVSNIKRDKELRGKEITLHFVTSNVPELDDEDQILENRFRRFSESLGYKELSATIHHYNSLALLNQVIFTAERPRSRLASEYRQLCHSIRQANPEDRQGALHFLRSVGSLKRGSVFSAASVDERLDQIAFAHSDDGEVLYRLANLKRQQGHHSQALSLVNDAVVSGYANAEALLFRAELQMLQGEPEAALVDLRAVLSRPDANYFDVSRVTHWLHRVSPKDLVNLPQSEAFLSLDCDSQLGIANNLLWGNESLLAAREILNNLFVDRTVDGKLREAVLGTLVLCLIGLREFESAIKAIDEGSIGSLKMDVAFNRAMASWGTKGRIDKASFESVMALSKLSSPKNPTANYRQCMGISYWAVGGIEEARTQISQSRQICMVRDRNEFSAWRFQYATPAEFLADLDEVERMIDGSDILPKFLVDEAEPESGDD